jgi:hypothetical protein
MVGGGVPRTPKVLIKTKRQSPVPPVSFSSHSSPLTFFFALLRLFILVFFLISASTLHRNLEIKVESWKEELELMSRETEGWRIE